MKQTIVYLLVFFSISFIAKGNHWPSFRGGQQNTGVSPFTFYQNKKNKLLPKAIDVGGLIWGTPIIDEVGNIYVGSSNKYFYAFDSNGKEIWKYKIFDKADSLIDSAAVFTNNGLIVIPGGDGYLHAVHKKTGLRAWVFKASDISDEDHSGGVIVNSFEGNVVKGPNGYLYAGSDNGHMYSIDQNGNLVWKLKTGFFIWSAPAFSDDKKWMVFGSLDGLFYVVDPLTGRVFGKQKVGGDIKSSIVVKGKNIYFGASNGKFFGYKVEVRNHKARIKNIFTFKEAKGEIYSSAAIKGGLIVFGSMEGALFCIDEHGNKKWVYRTYSPVASSPIISQDNVVLFGAKNSKLYALNLKSGSRIWSFTSSKGLRKVNLDASTVITKNGMAVNGSYQGKLHFTPLDYCLRKKVKDGRCEWSGKEDRPEFSIGSAKNIATLRFLSKKGVFQKGPKTRIGLAETLKLKVVVVRKDKYLSDRVISPNWLRVDITPKTPISYELSPNGKFLNISPKTFFRPDTAYKVRIRGYYYRQTTWVKDRFAWIGGGKVKHSFSFKTGRGLPRSRRMEIKNGKSIGISSLYLEQPRALDTYIPAALDGQSFIATTFGKNEKTGKFLFHIVPAYPHEDGVSLKLMAEPSKVFSLEGRYFQSWFRSSGSFKMAAMGGEIPFSKTIFKGRLAKNGQDIELGEFFVGTSCLKINGSGVKYRFPYILINQVCDWKLQLRGIGDFRGRLVHEGNNTDLRILSSFSGNTSSVGNNTFHALIRSNRGNLKRMDQTLSFVTYSKVKSKIIEAQHQKVILEGGQVVLSAYSNAFKRLNKADRLVVFLGPKIISEIKLR